MEKPGRFQKRRIIISVMKMGNEKLICKITAAVAFIGSAICYFFSFLSFKIESSRDIFEELILSAISDSMNENITLSPFNIVKVLFSLSEEESDMMIYAILSVIVFVLPFILAIAGAIIIFLLKEKISGIILCSFGGFGIITNIAFRIVVASVKIDDLFVHLCLSDIFSFDVASYLNLFFFVIGAAAGVVLLVFLSKKAEYNFCSAATDNGGFVMNGNYYEENNNSFNDSYNQEFNNYNDNHDEINYHNVYENDFGGRNYGGMENPAEKNIIGVVPNGNYVDTGYANDSDLTVNLDKNPFDEPTREMRTVGEIVGVTGRLKGKSFQLYEGQILVIGRDSNQCDIVLGEDAVYVSRKHCEVSFDMAQNKYLLKVVSVNGVKFDNGKKVQQNKKVYFPRGVTAYLGNEDNGFLFN